MSFPCAVTADLNRYLARIDEEDAREAIIDRRAADLILGDYNPETSCNFLEAIEEMAPEKLEHALLKLRLANRSADRELRDAHIAMFGDELAKAVTEYWEAKALDEAKHSVDNADCRHCFDEGCRRCDPPEPDWY